AARSRQGPARERAARLVAVAEREALAPDDLVVLVALAGEHDGVARPGDADRELDRGAAVRGPRPTRGGGVRRLGAGAPERRAGGWGLAGPRWTAARSASGSSVRGLSLVAIRRSAKRATASAISGRLARSRSPPQPKSAMSRPRVSGRSVRSTFSTASGVCA